MVRKEIKKEYPIVFRTEAGCLFWKHPTKVSGDDTPRYVPNPKSDATYCLQDCLNDYTPIYSKRDL